jgi:hypothetical protein
MVAATSSMAIALKSMIAAPMPSAASKSYSGAAVFFSSAARYEQVAPPQRNGASGDSLFASI